MRRPLSDISDIIIHCAATPDGNSKFTILDIDGWHAAKWQRSPADRAEFNSHLVAVGYHWVIHCDGTLETGRDMREVGAHAPQSLTDGYPGNWASLGICLIGTRKFSVPQWTTLDMLIQALRHTVPHCSRIRGHREVDVRNPPKECPGFDVQAWLKGGRKPLEGHII